MNYALYATKGTALFLLSQGISVTLLHWSDEHKESHVLTYLKKRAIDFVIDIPSQNPQNKQGKGYALRRTAIDFHIPLITNIQLAKLLVQALSKYTEKSLTIKSWQEYH
jgi:carbamoyl-phosphate synthase large subunit